MTEVYQISTQEGCSLYVHEIDYVRFLLAAKQLVKQQRAALRSKDKQSISACKKRENALLQYVDNYERYRVSIGLGGSHGVGLPFSLS